MAGELHETLVGDWRVGSLIDHGGSAAVFQAERDGQVAALKIIDPALEGRFGRAEQEKRVGWELKLVGRSHPHLVQIFDGGRCPSTDLLFVAMEFLPFENLARRVGEIPRDQIVVLIGQVAQAAQFLETLGICHRDLKPENIVITEDFKRAILLDLGILRPLDPGENGSAGTGDNFIGSIRYSPPEFVWRREEDSIDGWRAVTFYQLGAVLHDLITGHRVFDDVIGPTAALIDAVTNTVPSIAAPDVDIFLINLCKDCLQKDWKTRLALVRWESFYPRSDGGTAESAKTRVRAVLSAAGSAANLEARPHRLPRSALQMVGRHLRDQLRSVCIGNPDFPRVLIDYDVVGEKINLNVDLEPSARHQLSDSPRISIRVVSMGGDPYLLLVEYLASWGEVDVEAHSDSLHKIAVMHSLEDDLREELENLVYRVLAAAMAEPRAIIGRQIRIR